MTTQSFAEKLGPDLVNRDPIIRAVVTLVESGDLHDEEALVLLVKILAAEVESTRAQAIAIATRMPPPPMAFVNPEPKPWVLPGHRPSFNHTREDSPLTPCPECKPKPFESPPSISSVLRSVPGPHSDNCKCWECTTGVNRS